MDSVNEAFAIVGDINGFVWPLKRMLASSRIVGRRLIFCGDMLGPNETARHVMDLVSDRDPENTICLTGNHEHSFIQYLDDADSSKYISSGGLPVLRSYLPGVVGNVHAALLAVLPLAHVNLLSRLLSHYETDRFLASHAGLSVENPESRSEFDLILRDNSSQFVAELPWKKSVICGHYVQKNAQPFIRPRFVCLDTGCGVLPNGSLTVMLVPEWEFLRF